MHPQHSSNLIDLITPNQIGPQRMQPDRVRHFLMQGLLAVFLGVACAVPVMAAPIQLPAIVEPASQEHHVGKLIFVELVTPDLAAAKQFYAGLFGWTFRDIQAGRIEYAEAFLDGRPVAGLIHRKVPAGEHRQPRWLSFFAVGDVDAAKKIALQNGAKVLFVLRCYISFDCLMAAVMRARCNFVHQNFPAFGKKKFNSKYSHHL